MKCLNIYYNKAKTVNVFLIFMTFCPITLADPSP